MPGLCNPANRPSDWVEGAFDIEGNISTTCVGQKVKVINKSNGSNIRYDFDYTGGGINVFPFTEEMLSIPKTYTILQYGELNGKPMVACKQITAKPGIDFSYTLCNVGYEPGNTFMTGQIGVQVPNQDEIADHKIQYKIGTNAPIDVLTLPHNPADISVVVPNSISIYAVDATGNKVCERNESILGIQENPFRAEISLLEVKDSDKVEITLNGAYSNNKYSLYVRESGADYASNVKIDDFLPGVISVDLPDSTKSYCFFAERPTTCGGWESTTDICTIPFDTIEYSISSNTLSWENHIEKIFNTDYHPALNVTRKIESIIEVEIDRVPDNPITLNPFTSPYIHSIDCKKDYCYQIVATVKDRWGALDYIAESRSLKRCISRKDIKAPPITDLYTSVDGDAVDIAFTDDSGWALNKPYYFLYHSSGGNYVKADSATAQNPFDYTLQDPSQESLCFKVGYIDQCGSHSALSPEVCTIHLSYDDPNLIWTNKSPFSPDPVSAYEIEEVAPNPAIFPKIDPSVQTFLPDFGDREDEITYRVKATDSSGNISFSNLVKVLPVFGMYLPNAFTPNGDPHNQSLVLKGKKGMIKDFSLEVFDRNRNKVYATTDKEFSWNGHVNDVPLTPGTYLLVIKASLISGEVITQAEKITILY